MAVFRTTWDFEQCVATIVALFRGGVPLFATALLLIGTSTALSETKPDEYVVRIARETTDDTTCVLLQQTGTFHYEVGDRENTRVYEGELTAAQLSTVEGKLQKVSTIMQSQVEEPLTPGSWNLLDIHLFRRGDPQELLFRSSESQEAFKASLKPLLQWMEGLHKLPHRSISEDEGKNNCLPKRALALRKRAEVTSHPLLPRTPMAGRRIAPSTQFIAPTLPESTSPPLVWLKLLEKNSSGTQQRCAVVASDGRYRFESRLQKTGRKNLDNRTAQGQITTVEIERLRKILDAPALAGIRHHEPPDRMPLNIMGAVLDLSIYRKSELQDLILTDARRRNTFFYPGDADIKSADGLMQFVQQRMEQGAIAAQSPSDLNGCSQLP